MQWFIDLIKDWVIAQKYATQNWVLDRLNEIISFVLQQIGFLQDWVIAQAYATEEWVLHKGYATVFWVIEQINATVDWVVAQDYAPKSWVLEQLCTSTCRVYLSESQYLPHDTWTKLQFDSEDWDVNNEFADYKFTAKEAGYFQLNLAALGVDIATGARFDVGIYKNGAAHSLTREHIPAINYHGSYLSDVVHLNGTTDYIEGYVFQDSGVAKTVYPSKVYTYLSIHQLSKDSWL